MNIYYVAGVPYSDELYHHGILGQKWGIRRYQNPDGTLTPEGRKRYNQLGEHAIKQNRIIRRAVTGDLPLTYKRFGDKREHWLYKKADKYRNEGNKEKASKLRSKADAQRSKNIDRDKYYSKASTGKLFVQDLLMGSIGRTHYAIARQQDPNGSRAKAAVNAILANVPYVGPIANIGYALYDNKKRYGHAFVL